MSNAAEQKVYLQYGDEDQADGELVDRVDLPDGAYQTVLVVDGAFVDGEAGVQYEVWIVEHDDVDY